MWRQSSRWHLHVGVHPIGRLEWDARVCIARQQRFWRALVNLDSRSGSRVIEVSDRRQWYKIGSKAFTKPAAAGDVRGPAQEGAQPREQC